MSAERSAQVVLLDEALNRLEHIDQRKHKIIELRYFGGLTTDQIADLMGISPRTVMRDWQLAKAWLRREMSTS
jgi:RNA polymerase sigma factor (sigma-70 family)